MVHFEAILSGVEWIQFYSTEQAERKISSRRIDAFFFLRQK